MKAKKKPIPKGPLPGSPEWNAQHVTVAVMIEGSRTACAEHLCRIAKAIEIGCTSGIAGEASLVRGQWLSSR